MQPSKQPWRSWEPQHKLALLERLRMRTGWRPFAGPQDQALHCQADILLYGGAAGGGKTDLLLGVSRFHHRNSAIFRRTVPNLGGIIERSETLYGTAPGTRKGDYNTTAHRWRFSDGVQVLFASCQLEKDKADHQGKARDFYGFDEVTEFSESQFRFIIGWNRSTIPGQRCRVIATANPPMDAEGEWILRFWGAWLDPNHPNPALPGELRWYTTEDGRDTEVADGTPFLNAKGELVQPLSRTFIPARVEDNPALMASNYVAHLQALPEPMRSKMLYGDFRAGRQDDEWQVIPSEWVRAAQRRWEARSGPKVPLSTIGVDVARGGKDKTVLSPRHGNFFDLQRVMPGSETPNGHIVAQEVLQMAAGRTCSVQIDVIGVGSAVFDQLYGLKGLNVVGMNSAAGSDATDKSERMGFANKRSEWIWKLREALDPESGEDLALPPGDELRSDLCATRWRPTARGIQAEPKDCGRPMSGGGNCCVRHRIGRSPDLGDSLIYAHAQEGFIMEVSDEFIRGLSR